MIIQLTTVWRWGDKGINRYNTDDPLHRADLMRCLARKKDDLSKDIYDIQWHQIEPINPDVVLKELKEGKL